MIVGFNNEDWSTIGILESPENTDSKEKKVIILLHGFGGQKVGTRNFHVRFSRLAVKKGFSVFRFDLPGDGESIVYKRKLNYLKAISDLILYLKDQYNYRHIYLLGHCAGGVTSLEIAKNYPELITDTILWNMEGTLFSNPHNQSQIYRSPSIYLKRYLQKLFLKETWQKLFRRKIQWKTVYGYAIHSLFQKIFFLFAKSKEAAIHRIENQYPTKEEVLVFHSVDQYQFTQRVEECGQICLERGFFQIAHVIHHSFASIEWQREATLKILQWIKYRKL